MIPKKLEIRNFLSHEHSVIDFDNFNVALILGMHNNSMEESNGTGKSAILEAIRWVLFDKARHKKKDGIVKRDATACSVVFEFIIDNTLYRIIRKRNKVVSESDVTLEQWNGTEYEPIDCDTNTATDNKIIEIINFNHDVFLNSVYFKQGDISIFTESTPSKRKDTIKSLLKLDIWDEYQKQVKKHHSKISTQIEEKENNKLSLELLEDEIEQHDIEIKNLKSLLAEKNKQYEEINIKLIERKSEYQYLGVDHNGQQRLSELESKLSDSKKRLSKIKKMVGDNKKFIANNNAEIEQNRQLLEACEKRIKAKNGIDLDKKLAGLLDGRTKQRVTHEQINRLKQDIKLDKQCDTCLRPISSEKEAKQIKQVRRTELNNLKKKHNIISKKLKVSEESFKKLEKIVTSGQKAELEKDKIKVRLDSLTDNVKRLTSENKQLSNEFGKTDLSGLKKEINELKVKLNKNNIDKLKNEIKEFEDKLANTKKSIDKLNIEYGSKVSNRKELASKQKEQKVLHEELSKLNEELIVHDKLRQYFGKDGIQSIIIENVVDELENYTNKTLAKICNEPTSITIQMQRQSESGSWAETFDIEVNTANIKDDFESLSGGEKFRISLALRLAFSKILSKRMGGVVKFLLLDEVSSSLDPKGLSIFADIVKQLSNEMKILIITHDDRLKDKFEDIIIVEKDSGGSTANI